ncbi:MAG: peptidoglycan DD-metalloendopeptidase family protein [Patescibacteria group bacterium]|mgnify:CR=1 FL=1
MLSPLAAMAGFFSLGSLLAQTAQQTSASGGFYNSQTIPLLSPAVNLDPRPARGGGDIVVVAGSALWAQEGPEGTPADIANTPQNSAISVYPVHKGDTLAGIAKMFGVSVNTIVWANNTKVIHEGDQLIILPITGARYTVAAGDTLASIAKKFKADAGEIAQYNNIADDAVLDAGSILIIPNGEVPPTAAQAAQSAKAKAIKKVLKSGEPFLGGAGPSLEGYYSWPVAGGVVTQGLHGWNACDIGAQRGTDIYAAAAGTVIIARGGGGWNGGYGNYVVISHSNGTQTLYGHMSKVLTSAGAQVGQGDIIGKIGSTGVSTGAHLHFEVRGAVNPFCN